MKAPHIATAVAALAALGMFGAERLVDPSDGAVPLTAAQCDTLSAGDFEYIEHCHATAHCDSTVPCSYWDGAPLICTLWIYKIHYVGVDQYCAPCEMGSSDCDEGPWSFCGFFTLCYYDDEEDMCKPLLLPLEWTGRLDCES